MNWDEQEDFGQDEQKPFDKVQYQQSRQDTICNLAVDVSAATARLNALYTQSMPLDFSAPAALADYVKRLETLEDAAKELKTATTNFIEWFKKGVLPDMLIEKDITSMKVQGETGTWQLVLKPDMYVSIPAANREKVHEWLKENGAAPLVVETVNAGTFGAFIKGAYKDGRPYPEDLIKVTPYSAVQIRKA